MVVVMETKTLLETVTPTASSAETPESHGLDPDLYLGVIPAELGRGGVVNANGRVYSVSEFVAENQSLSSRVVNEFVDGEAGHPSGSPTFDVPVRLVGVTVESDGSSALASGRFAIMNTQVGRDIMTLHQAGMAVGVSSRGRGIVNEHKIDEDSPYWRSNPSHRGDTVDEVSEYELLTYDLVRVPSAGTHLKSATQEAQEAMARLCESGVLEVSHRNQEINVAKEKNHEEVVLAPVDTDDAGVEIVFDQEQIVKEACDAAVIAVKDNGPFASLTEKQRETLIRLASVIESADVDPVEGDELSEQVKRVADQAEIDRQRLIEAEETNRSLYNRVQALEEQIAKAEHAKKMAAAVNDAAASLAHGERIKGELQAMIAEGRIDNVEGVSSWAARLNSLVEGVETDRAQATGDAPVIAEDEADDIVADTKVEESVVAAPGLLGEGFAETLKQIIDKDRTIAGRR